MRTSLTNFGPGLRPTPCFAGNTDAGGKLTITPADGETKYSRCDGHGVPPSSATEPGSTQFTEEVACDSTLYLPLAGKAPCAPGDRYPRRQYVQMHPLPKHLRTMPNPCKGVPRNPWCTRRKHHTKRKYHKHQTRSRRTDSR